MTYDDWFYSGAEMTTKAAQDAYGEIVGDDAGKADYIGGIEYPCGILLKTHDGKYHSICGRSDFLSPDLEAAASHLWHNHAKWEIQGVPT